MLKNIFLNWVVACVFASVIVGCQSINANVDQSKLLVQVATMKAIEAGEDTNARAERVKAIAAEGQSFLDGENVSVSLLESAVANRLAALDLTPSDRVLANALVGAVVAELNARVGEGLLSTEQKYTVSQVLGWVEQAASFY